MYFVVGCQLPLVGTCDWKEFEEQIKIKNASCYIYQKNTTCKFYKLDVTYTIRTCERDYLIGETKKAMGTCIGYPRGEQIYRLYPRGWTLHIMYELTYITNPHVL